MRLADFDFELPEELIAQYPAQSRRDSRLLVVEAGRQLWQDKLFAAFPQWFEPGDLLVFNDTRVIPARLFGQKETGGKVEILVERILDNRRALVHLRASKSPKPGSVIHFGPECAAQIDSREEPFYIVRFTGEDDVITALERYGRIPLPPYIRRADDAVDKERYQTVYARQSGAVAAPTAGLHFDDVMLQQLAEKGVRQAYVTLHVGAGTFQPVRVDDVKQHRMHREWMSLSSEVVNQIEQCKRDGHRVIAVGTTTVRCLETAALSGKLQAYTGDTDIFITPGFQFNVVDALLTNFHLPQSTLMMLVCAFGGYDTIMSAYRHAVKEKYRFFSYGDAMLIHHHHHFKEHHEI